jgi:hypothetical protein
MEYWLFATLCKVKMVLMWREEGKRQPSEMKLSERVKDVLV